MFTRNTVRPVYEVILIEAKHITSCTQRVDCNSEANKVRLDAGFVFDFFFFILIPFEIIIPEAQTSSEKCCSLIIYKFIPMRKWHF